MSDDLVCNRSLCLDQAQGFIEAARRVGASEFPHVVYHLSLLALEEVGKASLIAGRLATGGMIDAPWVDKAMESHRRKLQWAIWSPIDRIDPADFEAAREFAERAHAMRLASLYVDAGADAADVPASEVVRREDADRALELVVACLNIGTIGYFWFERPGFERQMFDEVRDLEHRRRLQIERKESFWGDERAVALTDEHIDHAICCMMAFAPLPQREAEPIFRPYFDGLALIAKSDAFYSFDLIARHAFVASLGGALVNYGGWNGDPGSLRACFDAAFAPIMPDSEHREQMFRVLTPEGDPTETPLVNLRSAKQLADLYLILIGRRNWSTILRSPGDAMQLSV